MYHAGSDLISGSECTLCTATEGESKSKVSGHPILCVRLVVRISKLTFHCIRGVWTNTFKVRVKCKTVNNDLRNRKPIRRSCAVITE